MAKQPKTLDDLFHDTLKDIYYAEKKILTTLPKMAKAAQSDELTAAFEKHRMETEGQVERLEQVFSIIGKKPVGKTCDAIIGITEEGAEITSEYKGSPALDAGLVAAAQAVEHYEISRYGTLRTWAEELGFSDAAELLEATLEEEKATDEALAELAKSAVNQEASRIWTNIRLGRRGRCSKREPLTVKGFIREGCSDGPPSDRRGRNESSEFDAFIEG